MPFPEKKLIHKLFAKINTFLWKTDYFFGWGFCTECNHFSFNLHDSTDQGYHCPKCCNLVLKILRE